MKKSVSIFAPASVCYHHRPIGYRKIFRINSWVGLLGSIAKEYRVS